MNKFELTNINTSFESYQQIINFYNLTKNRLFENIKISLKNWFSANLSAALGGVLDILVNNFNTIHFYDIECNIINIIKKNDFLTYFGYKKIVDRHNTTIKYMKFKPTDGRFFHKYVLTDLLNRPELPEMTFNLKKKDI